MRLTEALDFYNSKNPSTKKYAHFNPSYEDQKAKKKYRQPTKSRRRKKVMKDIFG